MNVLIRYYSKHGSAKQIAERFADQWHADVKSIDETAQDDAYEKILCVCAVYMGGMNKAMVRYIKNSSHPNMALCLVGLNKDDAYKTAQDHLNEATKKLSMIVGIGGVLNFPEMGFFEQKIIAMVNKEKKLLEKIDKKKVYELWDETNIQQIIDWGKV